MIGPYRHAPLPALKDAERSVVDELRKIEHWCLEAKLVLDGFEYKGEGPSGPVLEVSRDLVFPDVTQLFFENAAGEINWGIGVVADVLMMVGSIDLSDWDNPASRRPILVGGSDLLLDSGSSTRMRLPGYAPHPYGYDLQLDADGETVIAVPRAAPDFFVEDLSQSDGVKLDTGTTPTGWFTFPVAGAIQPDLLEVIIPNGTEAGRLVLTTKVWLWNNSLQTGQIIVGISIDGATPDSENQTTFVVPAGFRGAVDVVAIHTMLVPLASDLPFTTWVSVLGDHPGFDLLTDGASGDHRIAAQISYS